MSPLAITINTLPWGRLGSWYQARLSDNGGGQGASAWTLSPGMVLPAGLTLRPDGLVFGTPTAVTVNVPITFQVTDAGLGYDARAIRLDIVGPLPDQTTATGANLKFSNGSYA